MERYHHATFLLFFSFSEEVNSRDSIISHNPMVGKNLQIKIRIDLLL